MSIELYCRMIVIVFIMVFVGLVIVISRLKPIELGEIR